MLCCRLYSQNSESTVYIHTHTDCVVLSVVLFMLDVVLDVVLSVVLLVAPIVEYV